MTIQVTGKIEKKGFGFGVWTLVSETGQTYELTDAPTEICQSLKKVTIEGEIQENVMTIAMVGPVLKVKHFTIISDSN